MVLPTLPAAGFGHRITPACRLCAPGVFVRSGADHPIATTVDKQPPVLRRDVSIDLGLHLLVPSIDVARGFTGGPANHNLPSNGLRSLDVC